MPYKRLTELPKGVRNNLPKHAQDIYLNAHNNALKQHKDPAKRRLGGSLEEVAARVAWAAVKVEYKKDTQSGNWKRKRAK